jgi:hypothetical protein
MTAKDKIESESVVKPENGNVRAVDPLDMPFEVRQQMFVQEYNQLVQKYGVTFGIQPQQVTPHYLNIQLVPIPVGPK